MAHVKLLTGVRPGLFNASFEGKIYSPGAVLDCESLPAPAVVLECAGYVGTSKGGHDRREVLWILWQYDLEAQAWKEIARAQSVNFEWSLVLQDAAIRALNAKPEFKDVLREARLIAGEILELIDMRVKPQMDHGVKLKVLTEVYDQVAGRIAEEAA